MPVDHLDPAGSNTIGGADVSVPCGSKKPVFTNGFLNPRDFAITVVNKGKQGDCPLEIQIWTAPVAGGAVAAPRAGAPTIPLNVGGEAGTLSGTLAAGEAFYVVCTAAANRICKYEYQVNKA
jgi:hypothetical protein